MTPRYEALTTAQRQDIRASQRTFEGAYIRTALSELSFGLLILRLFQREFLSVGIVYVASAVIMIILALYGRATGESHLITHPSTTFHTSGNLVAMSAAITLGSSVALLVLLARL